MSFLGLRYDLVLAKTMGKPALTEQEALAQALCKDVRPRIPKPQKSPDYLIRNNYGFNLCLSHSSVEDIFAGLGGPGSNCVIDDSIEYAYDGGHTFINDSTALMLVYLLNHLDKTKSKINCESIANYARIFFTGNLMSSAWAERSLIGYFQKEDSGFIGGYERELNHSFVRIFTDKVDMLFSSPRFDDYAVENLRNTLYKQIVGFWFGENNGMSIIDPTLIYQALNELLDLARRNIAITSEHTENDIAGYIGSSMLLFNKDLYNGDTYELNYAGLMSFIETVEAVGVETPEFDTIARRVRELS
jgi:hypothetical protein